MQLFDIGVNLTNARLSQDLDSVIQLALVAGVKKQLVTGTDEEESIAALALCHRYPDVLLATAGVHPHYAKDTSADFIDGLRQLAADPYVVAIGECGLDFNRNFSPRDAQLRVFEAQLQLACELQLPVFLHERDAFAEQVSLLRAYQNELVGGVAHCFTGDEAQMHAYLELGLSIGITGWVCDDKRGTDLQQAVKSLPLERLMLETDAPYLTPKNVRPTPKFNQPALLPLVAQKLAELREQDVELITQHAWHNALSMFTKK